MPFGVSSGISNIIIHAKFHVDRLRGFWAAEPPKVPFPILIGTTLTTVLQTVTMSNVETIGQSLLIYGDFVVFLAK